MNAETGRSTGESTRVGARFLSMGEQDRKHRQKGRVVKDSLAYPFDSWFEGFCGGCGRKSGDAGRLIGGRGVAKEQGWLNI